MNTTRLFSLIAAVVLLNTSAQAQFEAGQSFISGSLSTTLGYFNNPVRESKSEALNYGVSASWGRFTKENRASGWGISHNLLSDNYYYPLADLPSVRSASVGVDRFVEFYKPVFEKFALYIQPRVGLSYGLDNQFGLENDGTLSFKTQNQRVILGASLAAGIAWHITPKWALYGNFAFTNPISISGGISNTVNYQEKNLQGENLKSRGSLFEYNFSPSLSSGNIGLGFRYFYTRKNSDS